VLQVAALLLGLSLFAVSDAFAACPGCCSSHGGITNSCAANGNVICRDGTVSPSCRCSSCGVSGPSPPSPPPPIKYSPRL